MQSKWNEDIKGEEAMDMPYTAEFYSKNPGDTVYHNNSACVPGREAKDLKPSNIEYGKGTNRTLCKDCKEKNDKGE